jgi:hypothetical protein
MAVASVVPAKRWRCRSPAATLALALAPSSLVTFGTLGGLETSAASAQATVTALAGRAELQASPPPSGRTGTASSGVTLAVSDAYGVNVPAGSWVPVSVSVVNRRSSEIEGQVIVSVPVAQVQDSETCAASGIGFICGSFANPSAYSSGASLPEVTYRIPLSLAAGIAKQFVAYVLAESPYGNVQALVRTRAGTVVAKADAPLPVAYGAPQPDVLVVTQSPAAVPGWAGLRTPAGSHPQLQYTVPTDLPVSAAALGGFNAVAVDEADTSVLSPAQAIALQGYVDAGGTLVVAGGLDWRAATAGLPPGLLPAAVEGLSAPVTLPQVAGLLGAQPLRTEVDVTDLKPLTGSSATLTEGPSPLAVEWQRGSGQVVVCAFDPLAPPLSTWTGTPALMSRLFAPAFQDGYYGEQPSVAVNPAGSQASSHNVGTAPLNNAGAGSGLSGNGALLSPTTASQGLLGYLEQMPGSAPPKAYLFGILLLGYVVLVGPLCFWALTRLRRRELAWVAVPGLAVAGGLVLYLTGAGVDRPVMVNEVRVTQFSPGSHLAQLVSLGAVYLPRGGAQSVQLTGQFSTSPALIGDLGADAGAQLAVGTGGPGPGTGAGTGVAAATGTAGSSGQVSLTVRGPSNSLGGWGASGTTHLAGTVTADLTQADGALVGKVTNHLGVGLVDAQVVAAAGLESHLLGTLPAGASARLDLASSSTNGVPVAPFLALPLGGGSRAKEQQEEAVQSLFDLGSLYSGQDGGTPVLVAFTRHPLYPPDFGTGAEHLGPTDAVVVPLLPSFQPGARAAELGPELVGSSSSVPSAADQLGTGSLALQQGGSYDYQFVLPATPWAHVELNFGSVDGSVTSPGVAMALSAGSQTGTYPATSHSVFVSAFDYRTGHWERVRTTTASGQLVAEVPKPASFLGPGGALEVRLSTPAAPLNVYGEVPTLSATGRSTTRATRGATHQPGTSHLSAGRRPAR